MIKKTIIILACGALIAPVALAQTRSTHKKQTTTATEQPITVTGTIIKMTTGEGSAANYQPFKTLVVREDRSNTPGSYVLNGPGHVVNKDGKVIRTGIKPGTHVRVYYVNTGDSRMVDHVVVD
jgi:tRNA splicing endonuclease